MYYLQLFYNHLKLRICIFVNYFVAKNISNFQFKS